MILAQTSAWRAAQNLVTFGRTWLRTIRTKHATITRFRTQNQTASRTLVKKLTGIRWHEFEFGEPTIGTGDARGVHGLTMGAI